jgi:hypothetical protein
MLNYLYGKLEKLELERWYALDDEFARGEGLLWELDEEIYELKKRISRVEWILWAQMGCVSPDILQAQDDWESVYGDMI